ncbi:MAG: hypothetical protein JST75_09130 [Bacteroidetes bacterium]|nr:hypothetical protein [Bacteroidota bacterium]
MNLEEQWKNMANGDEDLSSLIKKGLPSKSSKDPLQKIKRNLLGNSIIGVLISIGYIFIMIKFPVWQVLLCIGFVFLFTVWATTKTLMLFAYMNKPNADNTLLEEMKRHYRGIINWMNIQQRAAWLIYPVSTAGGFMVGGSLGAGKPIAEIMSKPVIIIALLIAIVVLVPVCFSLAKWMCKKAFGEYAEQLKQNIDILQKEN